MATTLYLRARVLPGRRIEITAPELMEGAEVDVRLTVPEPAGEDRPSALEVIRSLQGHRLFKSPKEVDAYLNEERNSWNR